MNEFIRKYAFQQTVSKSQFFVSRSEFREFHPFSAKTEKSLALHIFYGASNIEVRSRKVKEELFNAVVKLNTATIK